jgi:hypothetical protein
MLKICCRKVMLSIPSHPNAEADFCPEGQEKQADCPFDGWN